MSSEPALPVDFSTLFPGASFKRARGCGGALFFRRRFGFRAASGVLFLSRRAGRNGETSAPFPRFLHPPRRSTGLRKTAESTGSCACDSLASCAAAGGAGEPMGRSSFSDFWPLVSSQGLRRAGRDASVRPDFVMSVSRYSARRRRSSGAPARRGYEGVGSAYHLKPKRVSFEPESGEAGRVLRLHPIRVASHALRAETERAEFLLRGQGLAQVHDIPQARLIRVLRFFDDHSVAIHIPVNQEIPLRLGVDPPACRHEKHDQRRSRAPVQSMPTLGFANAPPVCRRPQGRLRRHRGRHQP